jgi:carbamoyl-phosphate synthase small subunit
MKNKPVFSVQYHPEANPGPHDSSYLFDEFIELMKA